MFIDGHFAKRAEIDAALLVLRQEMDGSDRYGGGVQSAIDQGALPESFRTALRMAMAALEDQIFPSCGCAKERECLCGGG